MNSSFILFSDGGSRDNPGIASIGGVIIDPKGVEIKRYSQFIGISTNNVAEYTSLICGLNLALSEGIRVLECHLDSELAVKQINGEYKVKDDSLKVLHQIVNRLKSCFDEITFVHIPREKNKTADMLVNEAMDEISK